MNTQKEIKSKAPQPPAGALKLPIRQESTPGIRIGTQSDDPDIDLQSVDV
jgi:hypothetical protein